MKREWLGCIVAAALCGCTPQAMIKVDVPAVAGTGVIEDRTPADHYPGFLLGEGEIYSCRYGIHAYQRSEFVPPKQEVFSRLLAAADPALVSRHVRLLRFDIYRNYRPRLLRLAGQLMGSAAIEGQGKRLDHQHNPDAVPDGFSLQQDPGDGRAGRNGNQIGCDGNGEGEYFPADVAPGHDVIVIWLTFVVDDRSYAFRSLYPFVYSYLAGNDKAVAGAMQATVREAAAKVAR